MSVCDVCNVPTSFGVGTVYTVAEFKQIVSMGFVPPDATIERIARAKGGAEVDSLVAMVAKPMIITQWKQVIVANAGTDWLLCPSCASRASKYMHKMSGQGIRSKAGNVIEKLIGERPKEGCFIATATMGDYGHPAVLTLREFRDEYLERKWGRAFTRLYYKHAPLFAGIIEKRSALRRASYALIIMPLVSVSKRILKRKMKNKNGGTI